MLSTLADVAKRWVGIFEDRSNLRRSIESRDRVELELRNRAVPELAPFLTTQPVYPKFDYNGIIHEGFFKNELVPSGLRHIYNLFGQARVCVRGGDDEIVTGFPLVNVVRRPSSKYSAQKLTEFDLWEKLLIDLFLSGNAVWFKRRSASRRVVALQRLELQRVAIKPSDKDEYIADYRYETGGVWDSIDPRDIVHWKFPNPSVDPLDQFFGSSPLLAAMRAVASDNEMTDFTKTVLQNYAIPGVAIETQQTVEPKQAEEIKRQFRLRYGRGKRGDPAVLQRGMTLKPIGMNMDQLAFKDIRSTTEVRILMVLGGAALVYMVGAMAGIEHHTYSNYGEARESFADDIVQPLWRKIADNLTNNLLPDFTSDDSMYVDFDTTNVVAFSTRRINRLQSATRGFIGGLLNRHDALKAAGYPVTGPNLILIPSNTAPFEVDGDELEPLPMPHAQQSSQQSSPMNENLNMDNNMQNKEDAENE